MTLNFRGQPAVGIAEASSGPRLTPVLVRVAAGVLALLVVILAVRSGRDPARA